MGGILERIKGKKENPDPLKPLEVFFEESKRELEALLQKSRLKKKVVVVSYNITQIMIAAVVCIFLTGILTIYHFFPDQISFGDGSAVVSEDSGDLSKKNESPEAKKVRELRERLQQK
ncbi:MAG: hypothetical protein Q8Q92_03705 [bacterium]|nr:hypothetical protein [bacterium]